MARDKERKTQWDDLHRELSKEIESLSDADGEEDNTAERESSSENMVFDNHADYERYKRDIRDMATEELDLKKRMKKPSLVSAVVLLVILYINLFVMLYISGLAFIPDFSDTIIMFFGSITFIHSFALILLIFRYIFSPTNEILNHNRDL